MPAGFRHYSHKSAQNSCLDFFWRNYVENHSGIVRKIQAAWISVSACIVESRKLSEKCKLFVSSTINTQNIDTKLKDTCSCLLCPCSRCAREVAICTRQAASSYLVNGLHIKSAGPQEVLHDGQLIDPLVLPRLSTHH